MFRSMFLVMFRGIRLSAKRTKYVSVRDQVSSFFSGIPDPKLMETHLAQNNAITGNGGKWFPRRDVTRLLS